jgi:PAS domain S-box-containing protein
VTVQGSTSRDEQVAFPRRRQKRRRRMPRISTQVLLGLLIVLLLGPGLAFTSFLLLRVASAERDRFALEALSTARQVSTLIDRDLNGLVTTLGTLATSTRLRIGDVNAFRPQAEQVARITGAAIVLRAPDGSALINTAQAAGTPQVAQPFDPEFDKIVVERHQPAISGVRNDPAGGKPYFTVTVPVMIDGDLRYLLGLRAPTERIAMLISEAAISDRVVGIGDQAGSYVTRLPGHDAFSGKPGVPAFLALARGFEGNFRSRNPFGDEILAGYSHTSLGNWLVAVSVPVDFIEGPLRREILGFVSFGVVTLGISIFLVLWLWSRAARPLRRLANAGAINSASLRELDLHSPVREINDLAGALQREAEARDRVEAELLNGQARLRAILDTAPVAVVIAAPSGEIVEGNKRLEELLGPGRRLTGSFYSWPLYHADGTLVPERELPMFRVLRGEAEMAEIECLADASDGTRIWVRKSAAPIRDASGAILGGVASMVSIDREKRAEDILERKVAARTRELEASARNLVAEMASRQEAEQQLRQLQKMEAIGHLSGGIAHDFNNMLAVVMSGLNLIERRIAKNEYHEIGKYLDLAREGVNRAATLTKRLLAFSRQQALTPVPTEINKLVSGMSDLLRRTLGPSVQLETVLAGGLWLVNVDANQLESALLNLAINARDAMGTAETGGEEGKLTIETANYLLDETYARQHSDVPAGQYVMIAVSDTGSGMSEEVIAKAFDPFFTTKGPGKGTGLGLSMVYGFVKQSGGHVKIYSELGQGTTIKIYLPRHYGPAPEIIEGESAPAAQDGAGELILVVEDEDNMRRLTSDLLRELGYQVIAASNAANALAALDAHQDLALLFTDIVMPEMNGRKLADEVIARRPGLPVIFTTGFTRNAVVHNGVLDPGVNFLPKPFTLQQLAAKVREVLAKRA